MLNVIHYSPTPTLSFSQTITMLTPAGTKNEVEKFAEWLENTGKQGEEVTKKIKSLVGDKVPA